MSDWPAWQLWAPIASFFLATVASIAGGRTGNKFGPLLVATGGITATWAAADTLLGDKTFAADGWTIVDGLYFRFHLAPLGAWFLLIIGLPAVAAALYSWGYLKPGGHASGHGFGHEFVDPLVALFLAAMTALVMADSVTAFFFAWEGMALVSFFLVIGNGHSLINRRAGLIYGAMSHAGAACILAAFLILGRHAGSWDFAALRSSAGSLDQSERTVVFLLAVVGFGAKAGVIPLHIWLPRAHPAAPSHVSALMSGVMVKMAIYGLLLVTFEFLPSAPAWWGWLLIGLGIVSAVMGVLYSLMERDMKRILAYSTVENIGLIVLGIGAAMVAGAAGLHTTAALALVASLFHSLNHALFKGLLFMGAGAVESSTGTRDLERLGGLIQRLPQLAGLTLIGCAAIAALPPLNGFASEWLLLQSYFQTGAAVNSGWTGGLMAVAVAAVGLTSALSLVGFVRYFAVGFLAQPRSEAATGAKPVEQTMLGALSLMAAGCLFFGLVPKAGTRLLEPVTQELTGVSVSPFAPWTSVREADLVTANYAPVLIALGLVVCGALPWVLARVRFGKAVYRTAPTWVCGVDLQPRMSYSATAIAKNLRLIFKPLLRPVREVTIQRGAHGERSVRYEEQLQPVYERYVYRPLLDGLIGSSHIVRRIQSGSLRLYLTFFFVTMVVMLMVAR